MTLPIAGARPASSMSPTVAIYVRSSGPASAGHMALQTIDLQDKAARLGLTVCAVFCETRPESISDEMVDELSRYDVVLVGGLSRLSRDLLRAVDVVERLESAGVRTNLDSADPMSPAETREPRGTGAAGDEEHVRRLRAEMATARARREAGR